MEQRRMHVLMSGRAVAGASSDCSESSALSQVNETISSEHEETMDSLFECSNDEDGQYIDLLLNPERYTGKCARVCMRVWFGAGTGTERGARSDDE